MAETIVNLSIVVLILGMTYALTSEGLWGAALMFFNALFAGLIAFNFYEPLAKLWVEKLGFMVGYADMLCLLGLFIVSLTLLRLTTESLAPAMVRFPTPLYHLGRLVFGVAGSLVTMAIILMAFLVAPVDKKVLGSITYDSKPPFGQGLDRAWLGFFQYTTGYVFANYQTGGGSDDPEGEPAPAPPSDREFGTAKVFDPRGDWLIRHQNARPFGDEVVPAPEGAGGPTPADGAAAPGGEVVAPS